LGGMVALLAGLAVTGAALAVLHHAVPGAGPGAELPVLVAANLAAALLRFHLLRAWVLPGRRSRRTTGTSAS
ncbi:glycosyltransferase family 2 protein, partial [Actinospica acidiphila]|nr:glycosyltransferase family 2 protein [Actinospica acidiphila]